MNKIIKNIKDTVKKPVVEKIISTLGSRNNVGNAKKGVNLLSIVQKLSQKRAKASEEESPGESNK